MSTQINENHLQTRSSSYLLPSQQQRRWYEAAREFGRLASLRGGALKNNITLPVERHADPYTTPELTFRFHYFVMRKMNFEALVDAGMICAEHCALFEFADAPQEAWQSIERRELRAHG